MEQQLELPEFGPRRRSNTHNIADHRKERGAVSGGDALIDAEATPPSVDEILNIHEYERKRLGQELHDSTGQLLVSLQFSLSRLRKIVEQSGETSLIEEIGDTVRLIDQGIRSLAFMDYPAELGDRDIFSAIQTLVVGFARRSGIRTSFKGSNESQLPIDRGVSLSLLRVAQEGLVNIHRHAHARSAKVRLDRRPHSLLLTISDDGMGMSPPAPGGQPQGIGLRGMRHRVEALGGCFRIANMAHGTKLTADVPLSA